MLENDNSVYLEFYLRKNRICMTHHPRKIMKECLVLFVYSKSANRFQFFEGVPKPIEEHPDTRIIN